MNVTVVRRHAAAPAGLLEPARSRTASHEESPSHSVSHGAPVDGSLQSYTVRIPARPLLVGLSPVRRQAAAWTGAAVLAAWGVALLLGPRAVSDPEQRAQTVAAVVLCLSIGCWLLPRVVRGLFGRLRLDSQGVQFSPALCGFTIPWGDLASWNDGGRTFWFRSSKSPRAQAIPFSDLNPGDCREVGELLRSVAPERQKHGPDE